MRKGFALASVLACISFADHAIADTPLDVLGVEKSVNDAARRAQETGDAIARAFADQALRVIADWKKANEGLIHTAIDGLDEQSKKMFSNINNVASRIERGEAVSFIDLQQVMTTAGAVIDRLPATTKEPAVSFYWPTIIVPGSDGVITVRVLGTRLSDANPRISSSSRPITVKRLTDNQIAFDLDRSSLAAADAKATNDPFKLEYDVSKSVWYNPFSWWSTEIRSRDIDLTLLPMVPGSVVLSQTIREDDWDRQRLGPFIVGGVGKNNTYKTGWGLTPLLISQGWILDMERQEHETFDDNGGDGDGGSSCTGYDSSRFTNTFAAFNIQHGHKGGGLAGTSDAHQNCRIWVDLKKIKATNRALDPETKPLSWTNDVDFTFDPKMVSYKVVMKLYTGVSYNISAERDVPYSLFEVLADKGGIKFRPRPQRGF